MLPEVNPLIDLGDREVYMFVCMFALLFFIDPPSYCFGKHIKGILNKSIMNEKILWIKNAKRLICDP